MISKSDCAREWLTDPNDKHIARVVKIAQKIHHHLRFDDLARTLKYSIKNELDLFQLEKLATVKCNTFTVFLDSRVLKNEQALVFLQERHKGTCCFENKIKHAIYQYTEQTQTQQRNQCHGVAGQESHGVNESSQLHHNSLQNAVQLRRHGLDV